MKPRILAAALAAAGLLAAPAHAQAILSAEASSPGGVPHLMVTSLGEFAALEGVADMQIAEGQTLTNSLLNVAQGTTDVAPAPLILPFLMRRGAGPYASLGDDGAAEADKLRVLYTYRIGGFGLFAYDSKYTEGWDGLEGKTIINGPPRGAALTNARQVVQLVTGLEDGNGYDGLQANWGQIPGMITDGSADAHVLPINFPDTRITRGLAAGAITLWSVPKEIYEGEAMQRYNKAPGSGPLVIDLSTFDAPEGLTIISEDGFFRSPATIGADFVHADMDEELAYQLTKAMLKNAEAVIAKAPFAKFAALGETDPEITGMCSVNPLQYHPGAIRAWEEAGYTIPDCARP